MKKNVVILLLMIFVIAFAGTLEMQAEEKEINVMYMHELPWIEQAQEFTKQTGIKVNYIEIPWESLRNRALTSFMAGGSEFDVIPVRDDWVAEFASRGFLAPFDQFIKEGDLEGFPKHSLDNLSWEGKLYGMPRYLWLYQLYYNKEILEKAGYNNPPETWDEMIKMHDKIKGTGYNTFLEAAAKEQFSRGFAARILGMGGQVLDQEGRPAFNSEAGIRTLEIMRKLYETGTMSESSFEMVSTSAVADLFVAGNYAFALTSPATYPMSLDADHSKVIGKVGVALIPKGSAGSGSWCETAGVGIPSGAKNKELAWEFVKFVTNAEQQKIIAMKIGRIPTRPAVLDDEEVLNKYPHFAAIPAQMEHPFGIVKSAHATEEQEIIAKYTYMAVKGQLDPKQALEQAELEILSILAD